MAQDIRPRVRWRHILTIAGIMCLGFIGIDWLHFFLFGTKFTYLINPLSPTAAIDFFFYLFVFAGMAFFIGFFVTFETKEVVIAGFLGPFLFLFFNYFIILGILFINPAYATTLIPGWQWIWGMDPNWVAVFNEVLVSFTLFYLQSLFLFLVMATPFILVLSFTGNAFRQMMGWSI